MEIKDILKDIQSPSVMEQMKHDRDAYFFYNGAVKALIMQKISQEFKKKETIAAMGSRIVCLNILKKVVNKLAQVYSESPMRNSKNDDEMDNDLIGKLEDVMCLNQRMKEASRSFKRDKRVLIEIYNENKKPALRVLPPHTYRVYSKSAVNPSSADIIVQVLGEKSYRYWDDNVQFDFNEKGEISNGNTLAESFGTKPFIYINESTDLAMPIQSDDLLSMSIALPIVLTDMLFGLKYQCWSIIYTIGASGDLPFNPNSVIEMDYGPEGQKPEVGTIKPNMDVDKMLAAVSFLLEALLTTNNLKAGDVNMSVQGAASGISKIIDSADVTENREDQEEYFENAEKELFDVKLKKYLMPYWLRTGQLDVGYDYLFSPDFNLHIEFADQTVAVTEKDQVDIAKAKVEAELSSRRAEIRKLNPGMSDAQIEQLIQEIMNEKSIVSGSGLDGIQPDVADQSDLTGE